MTKFTTEHRQKISEKLKGHIVSEETKRKLSIAHSGKKIPLKTRMIWSKQRSGKLHPLYGKHHTEESKQKMSESKRGCKAWNKGIPHSEETCLKMKQNHANVSLENHPNWKGGISFLPYCFKFNKQLKETIRIRDNHTCQNPFCKLTQKESLLLYNQSLDVHHIHYDKSNCNPDLITLCHSCNLKANSNRDFHEQFYMNILNNRNLLFWSI